MERNPPPQLLLPFTFVPAGSTSGAASAPECPPDRLDTLDGTITLRDLLGQQRAVQDDSNTLSEA